MYHPPIIWTLPKTTQAIKFDPMDFTGQTRLLFNNPLLYCRLPPFGIHLSLLEG
jgi:hypothetical protein